MAQKNNYWRDDGAETSKLIEQLNHWSYLAGGVPLPQSAESEPAEQQIWMFRGYREGEDEPERMGEGAALHEPLLDPGVFDGAAEQLLPGVQAAVEAQAVCEDRAPPAPVQ